MKNEEIVKKLISEGYLLTPKAIKVITDSDSPDELIHEMLKVPKEMAVIDESFFEQKEKTKISIEKENTIDYGYENLDFHPIGKTIQAQVKIIGNDITENSSSTGKFDNFVEHFRNRYEQISKMLKTRGQNSHISIEQLRKVSPTKRAEMKVKLIIMINEKRTTKNGHILINGDDPTGIINILVPKNNVELIKFTEQLMPDEIIAVDGRLSKDLYIADDIFQPEVPVKEVATTKEDLAIVLTSDMHIGSKIFLKKNFEQFIDWLNGKVGDEKQKKLAEKVKYIVIAGDNVDGIGIYPGQENELMISDIFEQYQKLTEYIKQIPEHIHVIISPGNHDALKNADPQPKLPEELVPELYKMQNVTLVGNPSLVSIHGIKFLIYHGTCFIDFVNNIPGSKFDAGAKMMVDMLKRRHLHPMYGGKPITPEKFDTMVINDVPDVFHCGESHNNSYEKYRGVLCINSGTWQALTDYQIKQGHKATPAIVPVIETKYGKIQVIHFDKEVE